MATAEIDYEKYANFTTARQYTRAYDIIKNRVAKYEKEIQKANAELKFLAAHIAKFYAPTYEKQPMLTLNELSINKECENLKAENPAKYEQLCNEVKNEILEATNASDNA